VGDGTVLDALMADAWPPQELERHGRWRLRWASGVTRRANSALAIGDEAGDALTALVDAAEAFSARRAAPPCFLVSTASAPPGLDPLLAARGYAASARTMVMAAEVDAVVTATASGAWDLDAADRPDDAWFSVYWTAESTRADDVDAARISRDVLLAPPLPAAHVTASTRGEVAGVGQVVIGGADAVVQCMATAATQRRRGAATAVLHGLALEARARGTTRLCLAVLADNDAARGLYAWVGFTPSHEYHYRSRA
jgi:N-acetylglutamate synthase